MKKLEKVLVMLIVTFFAMRLLQIAGASLFETLSALLLMIFYLLFSFFLLNDISFRSMFRKASYRGIKAGAVITGIFTGFVLCNVVCGVLYKTMVWTGARVVEFVSFTPLLLLTAGAVLAMAIKRTAFTNRLLVRCVIWSVVAVAIWFMPMEWFAALHK